MIEEDIVIKKSDGETELINVVEYVTNAFYALFPNSKLDVKWECNRAFDSTTLIMKADFFHKGEFKNFSVMYHLDAVQFIVNPIDYFETLVKDFYEKLLDRIEEIDKYGSRFS